MKGDFTSFRVSILFPPSASFLMEKIHREKREIEREREKGGGGEKERVRDAEETDRINPL